MGERDMAQVQSQQEAFKSYVQQTASTGSTADELAKLGELMNSGALTQSEYDAAKAKVLG
jgi:membrane protease subunit (stomatin/prohibitin family)